MLLDDQRNVGLITRFDDEKAVVFYSLASTDPYPISEDNIARRHVSLFTELFKSFPAVISEAQYCNISDVDLIKAFHKFHVELYEPPGLAPIIVEYFYVLPASVVDAYIDQDKNVCFPAQDLISFAWESRVMSSSYLLPMAIFHHETLGPRSVLPQYTEVDSQQSEPI